MSKENRDNLFSVARPLDPLENRYEKPVQHQPELLIERHGEEDNISREGKLIIMRKADQSKLFKVGPVVLNGKLDIYDGKITKIRLKEDDTKEITVTNITKRPSDLNRRET